MDVIKEIYEIQNIGKGVINTILPENLLLLSKGAPGFQDVLSVFQNIDTNNTVTIEPNSSIFFESGQFGSYLLLQGSDMFSSPVTVVGISNGLTNTYNALEFYSGQTLFKDAIYEKGIEYAGDYEANFTARSLVSKQYVDSMGGGVPDATDTIKGKLKLTNDLGGTADSPTTPTALHIVNDEVFTGIKIAMNTGVTNVNGLSLVNQGTGGSTQVLTIENDDSGRGIYATNLALGSGFYVDNFGNGAGYFCENSGVAGIGLSIYNTSSGNGIEINNSDGGFGFLCNSSGNGDGILSTISGNGNGIVANASTSSFGSNFVGKLEGVMNWNVDKNGNTIGTSFIKVGGSDSDYLMADGSIKSVKIYKALLSQTGTNAPTVTVLDNTLGGTVVWTRTGVGTYNATLSGAFLANKEIIHLTSGIGGAVNVYSRLSDNVIAIYTSNFTGTLVDDSLNLSSITIEVYP